MAIFRAIANLPCQNLEADRTSDALRSKIRAITARTDCSDTPAVESMLTVVVVLRTLDSVLVVLTIDVNILLLGVYNLNFLLFNKL